MNNNTIIMPVRKRSPTSGNSVYTTQPTFTTTLPENPQTSFQTMRQVNADGSSTVYHVHDSINGGMGGGLPPQVILGGGGGIPLQQQQQHIMSSQQQQAPISGGIVYPYGQQQQQPNIVYVQSDEYSEDSDYESDNEESTALVQRQHNQSQSPRNKRKKCCLNSKSTSTICILTSILFAISFIVGYIFLIDAIVTNNRNNHINGNPQNVSPGSSLRIGSRAYRGIPSHIQHQQDEESGKVYNTPLNTELEEKLGLTEKYYVVKPMISEISIGKLPEGGVVGDFGGVGKSQQQQYQRPVQVDKQQNNQLVQEPRNGNAGSGGEGGSHMKDVIEEHKQQVGGQTRTAAGIVPRGSQVSRDGPVRRRR